INCIDRYLELVKPELKYHAFRKYKERLRFFVEYLTEVGLDHLLINQVTKAHVFDFVKHRQNTRQLSNKTYNHYLQALHTFFQYYIDNFDGYVQSNPCDKIRRLQVTKKGNRPFNNAEFPKLMEYCRENNAFLYQFCRFIY